MNREIVFQIVRSVIRHAVTVYGGQRLLSSELSGAIEGVIVIFVALIWSYLENMRPNVDAANSKKKP